jgi:hypothetical protein
MKLAVGRPNYEVHMSAKRGDRQSSDTRHDFSPEPVHMLGADHGTGLTTQNPAAS